MPHFCLMKLQKQGIILVVPIIIWNIMFYSKLPDNYQEGKGWEQFPAEFDYAEMGLRVLTFAALLFMNFGIKEKLQRIGLYLYVSGVIFYFTSWSIQIYAPESEWAVSSLGFSAPAWTSLIWLLGIGMMCEPVNKKTRFIQPVFF